MLRTDDIVSVIAALRDAGVDVPDPEAQGWGVQAQFADPDGNGFVLLSAGRRSLVGRRSAGTTEPYRH